MCGVEHYLKRIKTQNSLIRAYKLLKGNFGQTSNSNGKRRAIFFLRHLAINFCNKYKQPNVFKKLTLSLKLLLFVELKVVFMYLINLLREGF